jgi:hypothetical protein
MPASNQRTSKNYRCNKDIANIDEGFIEEVGFCKCVVQKVGLILVPKSLTKQNPSLNDG